MICDKCGHVHCDKPDDNICGNGPCPCEYRQIQPVAEEKCPFCGESKQHKRNCELFVMYPDKPSEPSEIASEQTKDQMGQELQDRYKGGWEAGYAQGRLSMVGDVEHERQIAVKQTQELMRANERWEKLSDFIEQMHFGEGYSFDETLNQIQNKMTELEAQ